MTDSVMSPVSRRIWRIAADLTTVGVLVCGILAMLFRENQRAALALLLLAAFGDYMDGVMARRAGGGTWYGSWLDVLSDIVAFGLAPIVLIWQRTSSIPLTLIAASVIYLAASAWRLYRTHRLTLPPGFGYLGLPMPSVAGLGLGLGWTLPIQIVFLGLLLTSALAVSRKRYPTLGMIWRMNPMLLLAALIAALGASVFIYYAEGLLVFMACITLYPWLRPIQVEIHKVA
jgi:CDP-diacylglycerol--serine O-phosphatidyltransferase